VYFPESKGRELEDSDRLFAGEDDPAITETMVTSLTSGFRDLEQKGTVIDDVKIGLK